MSRYLPRLLSGLLTILVISAASHPAAANGYGGARQLIDRAERAFAAGRAAEALSLLQKAITAQTTVDRKRQGYGYARYAHLRQARYYHAQGKTRRARAAVRRALAIRSGQGFVAQAYLVGRRHPFIVKHFPQLAKLPERTSALHKAFPSAIAVFGGKSGVIYGVDHHAVHRLRRTLVRGRPRLKHATLYRDRAKSLYRFFVSATHRRAVFSFERGPWIHHLDLGALTQRRIRRPAGGRAKIERLYLDRTGQQLVVYTGSYKFRMYRRPLAGQGSWQSLGFQDGRLLAGSGDWVLWATYDRSSGRRFHPYYSPTYQHIVLQRYEKQGLGKRQILASFPKVSTRSRVTGQSAPSRKRLAFCMDDVPRRRRSVHVWNVASVVGGKPGTFRILHGSRKCPSLAFSTKEDYLVLLERSGTQLVIRRYDYAGAAITELGRLKAPAGRRDRVFGFGVLSDNRTIWVHRGHTLALIAPGKTIRRIDLRRYAKRRNPEWAGADYHVRGPETLFLGIERGGGRYFMALPLKPWLRP